jgi:hypothetical protein
MNKSNITYHWGIDYETWYIAVHKNGFGIDTDIVRAIRIAQESVMLDDKPSQLAIYRASDPIEPKGFIHWPNGEQPRLVGLTNTHQGWRKRVK